MSLRWYAHNLDEYDRDTGSLTMLQHGAYRLMLDEIYKTGRALPADLIEVHIIARANSKLDKAAVSLILNRYFKLQNDGWHNQRADEELQRAREISERRSNAGASGAAKKKQRYEQSHKQTGSNCLHNIQDTSLETEVVSKQSAAAPFVLPDWVPQQAWENFIEVRKRSKANPTDRAKTLLVDTLRKLKEQGFSPQACIDAAIENSWKSFYPPPTPRHANGRSNAGTPHDTFLAGGLGALDKFKAA